MYVLFLCTWDSLKLRNSISKIVNAHVRVHACRYVCLHVCMFACLYVCMFVCLYVCMFVCLYVCMFVCLYVCMFVCLYACWCLRDCMLAWMHARPFACMHLHSSRALNGLVPHFKLQVLYVWRRPHFRKCQTWPTWNIKFCTNLMNFVITQMHICRNYEPTTCPPGEGCLCACLKVCLHVCMYTCMHVCLYAYQQKCNQHAHESPSKSVADLEIHFFVYMYIY